MPKTTDHPEYKMTTLDEAAEEKRKLLEEEFAKLDSRVSTVDRDRQSIMETINYLKAGHDETRRHIGKLKDALIQQISQAAETAENHVKTFSADAIEAKRFEMEKQNSLSDQLKEHRVYTAKLMDRNSPLEIVKKLDRNSELMSQTVPVDNSILLISDRPDLTAFNELVEKHFKLTLTELKKVEEQEESKLLESTVPGGGITGITWTRDNKAMFVCQDGGLFKVDVDANKWTDVSDLYRTENRAYDVCVDNSDIAIVKKGKDGRMIEMILTDFKKKKKTNAILPFASVSPRIVRGPTIGDQQTYVVIEDSGTKGESAVHYIDCTGNIIKTYGKGELRSPTGVVKNERGELIVTDFSLDEIIMFHSDGSIKQRLRQHNGLNKDQLSGPLGVSVDADRHIFVSSSYTNAILLFSSAGDYLQTLQRGTDGLNWPTQLSMSSDGRLAVVVDDRKVKIISIKF